MESAKQQQQPPQNPNYQVQQQPDYYQQQPQIGQIQQQTQQLPVYQPQPNNGQDLILMQKIAYFRQKQQCLYTLSSVFLILTLVGFVIQMIYLIAEKEKFIWIAFIVLIATISILLFSFMVKSSKSAVEAIDTRQFEKLNETEIYAKRSYCMSIFGLVFYIILAIIIIIIVVKDGKRNDDGEDNDDDNDDDRRPPPPRFLKEQNDLMKKYQTLNEIDIQQEIFNLIYDGVQNYEDQMLNLLNKYDIQMEVQDINDILSIIQNEIQDEQNSKQQIRRILDDDRRDRDDEDEDEDEDYDEHHDEDKKIFIDPIFRIVVFAFFIYYSKFTVDTQNTLKLSLTSIGAYRNFQLGEELPVQIAHTQVPQMQMVAIQQQPQVIQQQPLPLQNDYVDGQAVMPIQSVEVNQQNYQNTTNQAN